MATCSHPIVRSRWALYSAYGRLICCDFVTTRGSVRPRTYQISDAKALAKHRFRHLKINVGQHHADSFTPSVLFTPRYHAMFSATRRGLMASRIGMSADRTALNDSPAKFLTHTVSTTGTASAPF